MAIYARVVNGLVAEVIQPLLKDDGSVWPIADRYTTDLVAEMVDITSVSPQPQCWWTTSDGGKTFLPPSVS